MYMKKTQFPRLKFVFLQLKFDDKEFVYMYVAGKGIQFFFVNSFDTMCLYSYLGFCHNFFFSDFTVKS